MRFPLLQPASICALYAVALALSNLWSEGVAAQDTWRFEVASIKPLPRDLDPLPPPGGTALPTGRVLMRSGTAGDLIRWAYPEFNLTLDQIVGGPPWLNVDLFEVQATFDPQKLTQKLPVDVIGIHPSVPPAVSLMMRALLEDRFGLRIHVEERPINVTAVLLANADGQLGPRLRRSRSECPETSRMFGVCGIPIREGPPRFYQAVGVPFSRFVGILRLTEGIEDIVHDLTGLEGLFDFEVPAYPKGQIRRGEPNFSVVQKQHGLKLERRRVQGRFLHIDGIRPPSPN